MNMRKNAIKPFAITDSAFLASPVIEPEGLFIQIPKEMERFDVNVGSLDATFQQAPVVFESVGA